MSTPDWRALWRRLTLSEPTRRVSPSGRLVEEDDGRGMITTIMHEPVDWYREYQDERNARLDAEARLRGLLSVMGLALAALVTICALAGCLRATNGVSRAVARWEVSR